MNAAIRVLFSRAHMLGHSVIYENGATWDILLKSLFTEGNEEGSIKATQNEEIDQMHEIYGDFSSVWSFSP